MYAYNRIRVVFAMTVWSYFDDSAIVERRCSAQSAWFMFLKVHSMLRIPLKGNPLCPVVGASTHKFFPPAESWRKLSYFWLRKGNVNGFLVARLL